VKSVPATDQPPDVFYHGAESTQQASDDTLPLMMLQSSEQISRVLSDAVGRLRGALSPAAIYLYGSYAYGTPGPHSDIDLLVVVEQSSLTVFERDAIAYRALGDIPFPIDVQVYTEREFEERAALPVSFERTVKLKRKRLDAA
jgi:predicted nucleotidyltransferase